MALLNEEKFTRYLIDKDSAIKNANNLSDAVGVDIEITNNIPYNGVSSLFYKAFSDGFIELGGVCDKQELFSFHEDPEAAKDKFNSIIKDLKQISRFTGHPINLHFIRDGHNVSVGGGWSPRVNLLYKQPEDCFGDEDIYNCVYNSLCEMLELALPKEVSDKYAILVLDPHLTLCEVGKTMTILFLEKEKYNDLIS